MSASETYVTMIHQFSYRVNGSSSQEQDFQVVGERPSVSEYSKVCRLTTAGVTN